jgi:uncharacterized protein YabE (DUF348 family)/3D (Asp-Asp-Asp) domain-containing protein
MEESSTVPLCRGKKGNKAAMKQKSSLEVVAFTFLALLTVFTFLFCCCKIIFVVDGEEEKRYFTFSRTVEELCEKKGLEINVHDAVKPDKEEKIRDGDLVKIYRAKPVFLVLDGGKEEVWTYAHTVGDFLKEKNILLQRLALVFPELSRPLQPHDEIKIMNMEENCFIEREPIPYKTVRINNPQLEPGAVRILQNGNEGYRENIVESIEQNGRVIYSEVISSRTVAAPVNRILEYGDNTTLSRGGGTYNFVQELEMVATAYCPGTPGSGCPIDERGAACCTGFYNDGFTFTGIKAVAGDGSPENPHIIAVDPNIVPLKSLVYIEGYGFARAEDTGGAIKKNRIDLLFNKHEEALQFGRKNVKIYLIRE